MKSENPDPNLSGPAANSTEGAGGLTEKTTVIPVIEEQVHIVKQTVESGRVRISKNVSEEQETVSMPLNHEEVDVKRVEVNKYVDTPPLPVRHEGDTMIIPVLREVLVVEKRLLLVEELHVTKKQVQTEEVKEVTLRKEEVNVERNPVNTTGATPGSPDAHK